ncbi:MAG: hemolysin family protein [Bacteroidota bacterium]
MNITLLIIFISLLLSAFFSGMEIAYVSSNKVYVEIEKNQGDFLAKILKKLTHKPSKFIASMLIGNNIALVVYGFFMGDFIYQWLENLPLYENDFLSFFIKDARLLTQTLISTFVILFTAEFFPKVFFQLYANTLLKFLALPAFFFYQLFSIFSDFVIWISDIILKRFFKIKGDQVQLNFSKVELGDYINEQMEVVEPEDEIDSEIQIFQNALDFSELKAREVMIPRNEIIAVDISKDLDDLRELFTETGLSKILVYKENKDDIVGYVHSFEMFKKPSSIKNILLPVVFTPETILAKDVMNLLIKKGKSIAIVIDEYGGTSGMITVEDIVEELFGEIEDEHDAVILKEQTLDDNHYIFSARLEVDYLNETYKINLPKSENYETLSGLIVNYAEEIPVKGEAIHIDHFHFKILEASHNKIDVVDLKIIQD